MNGWTLEVKGVEKTFADWGLSQPRIEFVSQATDSCEFSQPGAEIDSTPIFDVPTEAQIRNGLARVWASIYLDGVRKFYGFMRFPKRSGSNQESGFTWRMENPWSQLERIVFRQLWKVYGYTVNGTKTGDTSSTGGELLTTYSGRLFLGQRVEGSVQILQSSDVQIIEIVNWAIAQGAHLQLDTTGIPSVQTPVYEVKNAMCSECFAQMLRLAPDAVTYFDYATTPYPTLKIKRRGSFVLGNYVVSMPAVNLDPNLGIDVVSITLAPKDNLIVATVVMEFEQVNSVNGQQIRDLVYDIYPVGSTGIEENTLIATINLEGANVTYATASIITVPITSNSTDPDVRLAWWKIKRPEFAQNVINDADPDSTSLELIPVKLGDPVIPFIRAVTRTGSLPNELTAGQYASWMGGQFTDETIQAYASYSKFQKIGGLKTEIERFIDEPINVKIKTTSLHTGTFNSGQVGTLGEAIPVGMSKFIYESTSVLQYDGEIVFEEDECSGIIGMGNVVNLLNAAPEFALMNALVQRVTWDIESGRTSVSVGFPRIWQAEDLMEMLRGLRYRTRYTPLSTMATGLGGTSGNSELGKDAAKESNTTGKAGRMVQTWQNPSNPTGATVKIDIEALQNLITDNGIDILKAGIIQPRLVVVSKQVNGVCVTGKMIILSSDFIS